MKKYFKILFFFVLVFVSVLAFSACEPRHTSTSHRFENGVCTVCGVRSSSEGLLFEMNSDGVSYTLVGKGTCRADEVFIDTYNNLPVTAIADNALYQSNCKKVTLGNSVTSIGEMAFAHCDEVKSITIPDGVTSVGDKAFYSCDVLDSVTIGEGVTNVGNSAFEGCHKLTDVYITDLAKWCSINFGNTASNPLRYAKMLYVDGASLTELVIPNGVERIGDYAFCGYSGLKSVSIPDSVISIGNEAFYSCRELIGLILGNGITTIEKRAFSWCVKLTGVTIPGSVTSIGEEAFYGCDELANVTLGNGLTNIEKSAFSQCDSITSIAISENITVIGDYAFSQCSGLKNITVDENNTVYKDINGSLYTKDGTTLLQYAIGKTESSFVIPSTVTNIGVGAFSACSELVSVTISENVSDIAFNSFFRCSLVEVINKSAIAITKGEEENGEVARYAFEVHNGDSKIVNRTGYLFYSYDGINYLVDYVGNESELLLPSDYNGEKYEIYKRAFSGIEGITNVTLSNAITVIGSGAFSNCTGLVNIVIPTSVKSIGSSAFYGCSSLESIKIPNGITTIEYWLFEDCTSLTSVTIPDSVTCIEHMAFSGCSNLKNITIPDSVTKIGSYAFSGCSRLLSVVLPEGITKIENDTFLACTALTSIAIPNTVRDIESSAFSNCTSLTSITIGYRLESIGKGMFNDCTQHIKIKYRGTEAQWKAISKGSDWNSNTGNYTIIYNYTGK